MTSKNKNTKPASAKPANAKAGSNKAGSSKKAPVKKEHGIALTIVLVIMIFHGILAAIAYNSMSTAPDVQRPWIVGLMVAHSLANIVAAIGIYLWKKWSLYVYAASTIAAIVAGLLAVGAWSVFYMVLPAAIVGWVLRTKWAYFD